MDIGRIALGLLSLMGGYTAIRNGSRHLSEGLRPSKAPGARSYGRSGMGHLGLRVDGGRASVRTEVRDVRRRPLPKLLKQGQRKATQRGQIRTTLREVHTLDDRLATIIDLAHKGKFDPEVIAWTRKELTKKCGNGWNGSQWCVPEKDTEAEIIAIFKALRRDTRYTSDILGADTYMHPRVTTRLNSADCDDFSSKGAAALMSVGIPVRFKVIQTKRSSTPDHIFIQAGTPKDRPTKWVSLDASVPMPPGWEAPKAMVSKEWIYPA